MASAAPANLRKTGRASICSTGRTRPKTVCCGQPHGSERRAKRDGMLRELLAAARRVLTPAQRARLRDSVAVRRGHVWAVAGLDVGAGGEDDRMGEVKTAAFAWEGVVHLR